MLDVWGAASSSRSCLRWRKIDDKDSDGLFFGLPHTTFSGLASYILQILNRPLNIVRSTLKDCFKLLGRSPAMLSKLVSMPHDLSLNLRFSFHQLTKSIEIRILIPTSVRGTPKVGTDQSSAFQKELKQKRPCLGDSHFCPIVPHLLINAGLHFGHLRIKLLLQTLLLLLFAKSSLVRRARTQRQPA